MFAIVYYRPDPSGVKTKLNNYTLPGVVVEVEAGVPGVGACLHIWNGNDYAPIDFKMSFEKSVGAAMVSARQFVETMVDRMAAHEHTGLCGHYDCAEVEYHPGLCEARLVS